VSYTLDVSRAARRDIAEHLPLSVATAVLEFAIGDLVENPQRAGRRLAPPDDDLWSARKGPYRVLYRIDEVAKVVRIVHVAHRRDVYRPR
jgi:mRNA interferase RelE/StbE